MLSIGIVAPTGVDYYMQTVGSGLDDYYARSEPGRWIGAGAELLGLAGEVGPAQVDALVVGAHPGTGLPLGMRIGKVAAFDLTFSAPKSVSLLAGLADPVTRAQVEQAHAGAVAHTVAFIEAEGVLAGRRGSGGCRHIGTTGAVAAEFVHHTSRAGDPQLHTHLLVFNRAQGADGRWGGVDGRRLFGWAKTAGYVYQAALRAELTDRLGVEWRPVLNGAADLIGFSDQQLDAFSTRRIQIEAALDRAGHTSPRAAQVATLATRPARPEPLDPATQRAAWRAHAQHVGIDTSRLEQVCGRVRPESALTPPDRTLAAALAGPDGLTAHRSAFDRRDVIRAVAEAAGSGATPAQLSTAADTILRDTAFAPTGRDSRMAGPFFSTVELMAVEQALLAGAARRAGEMCASCSTREIAEAIASRPGLSDEQQRMVSTLCGPGPVVEVVVGRAGTGKTFALDAARQAWTDSGIPVVGSALAARTAAGLQAATGIPSTTVDQLLADLARPGPDGGLPRRGVLIVDEAGLVGTRKLAVLLDGAERARTKVVLIGDPRQLPEVEAGGAFAALARRDPIELTVNRRQTQPWEREALDQLRHGDVSRAVTVYRDRQRITLTDTADAARRQLVDDWWEARQVKGPDRVVMISLHQADVDDLNARARQLRQADRELTGPTLTTHSGRQFCPGDEVMALRNDRRLGVTNGTRAVILTVLPSSRCLELETTDGRRLTLPAAYLDDGHLTHGYAMTAYKAQGLTTGYAFVLGSDRLYREAGYTALSRATEATHLYHVAPPALRWQPAPDPHVELTRLLSRSGAQTLASEPAPIDRAAVRDAALADPGDHLLSRIGPPPPSGPARDAWAAAATAIDTYRQRYDHHGPDPLGPSPDDPAARREWDHARTTIDVLDRQRDLALGQHLTL